MEVILSRKLVSSLTSKTPDAIRVALSRGRLVESDAFDGERVNKGITLRSIADYFGWSDATCQQILIAHGVPKGVNNAFLDVRDPSEPATQPTYGDAAKHREIVASYEAGGDE